MHLPLVFALAVAATATATADVTNVHLDKISELAKTTTLKPTTNPRPPPSNDFYIHHDGYSLLFNCERRTADRWNYTLATDKRDATRPPSFYSDPSIPAQCQQYSTKAYAAVRGGYDRGHLVASSMMTDSPEQRHQSHYMTNIAPQVSSFNQGIWVTTEDIEACYRNLNRIYTWGGILYTDEANDHFYESHGIRTPDYWWKVVLTKDSSGQDKIISWFFPNQENLGAVDKYLVSVNDIEARLTDGLGPIPVPAALKSFKATTSWAKPAGCSRA
ncbi:hypothetical protein H310_12187 [Aphanomyces invadans]|uniref:Endonuclease n=1 Tax=Aphanomyces invadans TaxID=157072 RepID=A0A024TIL1_9STRA|nr:hypothetical protein H310_12187 [Aphanomyces invadans]ETV93834.1 hypothetical protein H310_12187 [Aphanomyces invadans]|eukprot:XP_008877394.1 hypothetical protein H310_12187 [Aphanomyces invadans]